MPTYDYECSNCGHVFEMRQSITAKPKKKPNSPCENCGELAPIQRLIGTGGAVLFKGTGFYETDYRSESYKKAAKAEQSTSTDSKDKSSKSSSKTDSKKSDTKKPSGGSGKTAAA